MGVRVGVPRALWYYSYYPFWREFFAGLGASLVPSRPTTKATLDHGILDTVSEACVPIKVFFGHVRDLIGRWENGEIDMLFLPRYVSWQGRTVFCPKFLGLPDMVKHTYDRLPPLLEPRVDRRAGPFALLRVCNDIRLRLGGSVAAFWRAFIAARRVQRQHEKRLQANWRPADSIRGRRPERAPAKNQRQGQVIRLAVLGYPYLVHDDYLNLGLIEKLRNMGAEVVTAEALVGRHPQPVRHWAKPLFWIYSDIVARAGVYALSPACRDIDGVIHVTAFGCGPDATVDKLLELEARRTAVRPFLSLCLDEQTGEAGCLTRLEAFVDMLRRHKQRTAGEAGAAYGERPVGAEQRHM
jgi:predicted nucleotide-binding protein (sugar kinase/HSP70/actin superfamily)